MRKFFVLLCVLLFLSPFQHTVQASSSAPIYKYNTLEWQLTSIAAPFAWAHGADGHGQTIMIIDTGLDRAMANTVLKGAVLPSLAVNPLHSTSVVPCPGQSSYEGIDTCTKSVLIHNTTPYGDTVGHGSWIACAIACNGTAYNYLGVAPKAHIIMAKVFGPDGTADPQDVATAIRWAVIHHVHIISMSIGSDFPSDVEENTVAWARTHGVTFIAAAGNDGLAISTYPGSDPGVVRVAAVNIFGKVAPFSNSGLDMSLASPGEYVPGVMPNTPNEIGAAGFVDLSGTSMATPIVAAAVADLASIGVPYTRAVLALEKGATWSSFMDIPHYGHGIVNLKGALVWLAHNGK